MMKFKGRLKMNLDKIKLDLVKLIKNKKGVSFVEIEIYFDEVGFNYNGEIAMCRGNENIVFWNGWNEQACNLIHELLASKLITMDHTDVLIYYIDGKVLTLPVYKSKRSYAQWLPVEFN